MSSQILKILKKYALPLAVVITILVLVGFWDKIPFAQDIQLAIKGWLSDKRIDTYDRRLSDLGARIDSVSDHCDALQRTKDSLGYEIAVLRGTVAKRTKSIDSIKRVLDGLESEWGAHEGKESLYGHKIADVNRFVDSMLVYRDSVLNGSR